MGQGHDATASLLGYLFQCRYALLAALDEVKQNPGHEISIERFDDIAFEINGTPSELIQTKHHAQSSDLSENSVEVWKTLLIWIKGAISNPQVASKTRFVLLTTSSAANNSALSMLRNAAEHRNVAKALQLLISAARGSTNVATKTARELFLNMDEALRTLLLSNVWVFDNAPNIIDVRSEIEIELTLSAPPGKVVVFTDYLEGWWFSRVISGLVGKERSPIPLASLLTKISDIRDDFRSDGLPLSPDIEHIDFPSLSIDDTRAFVQQMRIIDLKESTASAAVQDYYKAFTQRSKWAREELLLDDEAERYERSLRDAFEREASARDEDAPPGDDDSKKTAGRELLHWSRRFALPLRNRDELWLSSGSFQMLSDREVIGWHCDYKSLLAAMEQKE